MVEEDRPKRVVLRLTDEEWETVRAAAHRAGFDELEMPGWIRKTFLAHLAPGKSGRPSPPIAPGTAEQTPAGQPPTNKPKCNCGLSRDSKGFCDGSCIMRL